MKERMNKVHINVLLIKTVEEIEFAVTLISVWVFITAKINQEKIAVLMREKRKKHIKKNYLLGNKEMIFSGEIKNKSYNKLCKQLENKKREELEKKRKDYREKNKKE